MFEGLTSRLSTTFKKLSGTTRITEDNISDIISDVRKALIEADVALPVVKTFIENIKTEALGKELSGKLTPEQEFIGIVNKCLIKAMGDVNEKLSLKQQPPAIVLVAGLQGAGKTTSIAKLAKFLQEKEKKKVLVVSADVYRPAAIKQLETLAHDVKVDFFPSTAEQKPVDIVTLAKEHAKQKYYDILLVDTAGRLHVDESMMDEIKQIHKVLNPIETLFTVDAMTGQDAANTAKAFNEALPLTGIILTKLDGDTRGGAALSIREITGKPIKFIGVGEKTDALQPFYPDRIASRILDMGDVLTIIDQIKDRVDADVAKKTASKIKKTGSFDLNDFLEQLKQVQNMGGVGSIMDNLPGMNAMKGKVDPQDAEKKLKKTEAIILSMTPKEREKPELLKATRKQRIAKGSGTTVQDINAMLTQFEQLQKVMKMFKGKGMGGMMRQLAGLMGKGGMPGMPNLGGGFPGFPFKK